MNAATFTGSCRKVLLGGLVVGLVVISTPALSHLPDIASGQVPTLAPLVSEVSRPAWPTYPFMAASKRITRVIAIRYALLILRVSSLPACALAERRCVQKNKPIWHIFLGANIAKAINVGCASR
jgi:hypothetical protein